MRLFNEQPILEGLHGKIRQLKDRVYTKAGDVSMTLYASKEPLPFARRTEGERRAIRVGDSWGELFDCGWFQLRFIVPPAAPPFQRVLIVDVNGEGLIFNADGAPRRGITNGSSAFDLGESVKRVVQLEGWLEAGEAEVWMDAGNNDLTAQNQTRGVVKEAFVALCDPRARTLYYDMLVFCMMLQSIPRSEPQWYEILDHLKKACAVLHDFTPEELEEASRRIGRLLQKKVGDSSIVLTATGHAHIDLAWLWPIRETKRKGARTFSTALDLMDRYEEYVFGASQAQLYQWIKEDYPVLYERIRRREKEGRWELQGAMWVEADTNLSGGEALVRQLLYGNRFWQKEFGHTVDYLWLPDVFGYTAALPQILKKSGVDYFSTIKISWNTHTSFPYTTFYWRGLDGSEVLAHMPPEGNYLSEAKPGSLLAAKHNMAARGQYGEALMPFGIGDGGGGPSPRHLEYLRREKDLWGLPPIRQGRVADFFHRLEGAADYPVYDGELYLERHQGTYTTNAKTKQYNRRMEFLLRDTEILCSLALRLTGHPYPQEQLEAIWKEMLLYQFHDILPGSSIDRVYAESHARYEALLAQTAALREKAAEALAAQVDTSCCKKPLVLFNTLSFARSEYLPAEGGWIRAEIPAMGYCVVDVAAAQPAPETPAPRQDSMENDCLRVEFAADGSLASVYDKRLQKELLAAPSNCLLFYEDSTDAWDIPYAYRETPPRRAELLSMEITARGPVVQAVQQYRYNRTAIRLELTMAEGSARLDIQAAVDWQEKGAMLRVGFYPNVRTETADCDIQFGYIPRSTRENNEYQKAQLEICGHKWVSLAETGLGVAVLSRDKYGWYCKNGVIELNALRSTDFPSHYLDLGEQRFAYALLAEEGGKGHIDAIEEGYRLNADFLALETARHDGALPPAASLLETGCRSVLVEAVKKAEDSDDLIVRTYEACGGKARARLRVGFPAKALCLCDLAERDQAPADGGVDYTPFEIQSIRVR